MILKHHLRTIIFSITVAALFSTCKKDDNPREVVGFNWGWKFFLGDDSLARFTEYDDRQWRQLNLPHDWSIEGEFSEEHPTKQAGGALPAGMGWYRKSFNIPESDQGKKIFIDFGGVYRNSEVWINDNYLGKRPFGYISFRYDLTPYLKYGDKENVIAVKADNSLQPNSRWYTGSGIYRKVELVKTNQNHIKQWGVFVTTDQVSEQSAEVAVQVELESKESLDVQVEFFDSKNKMVAATKSGQNGIFNATISNPNLWSPNSPNLYSAKVSVYNKGDLVDQQEVPFGIRYFNFDSEKGFFLNGEPMKIYGVNNHHDLGALGAAFNVRAAERQLEILKDMGCNAIRMAHNPPAEELLDLCDQMGFLVIDESFDEWAKKKAKKGYHLEWDDWHVRDLEDMVKRDRNHPSIIAWSIGNEIREQFDSTGLTITRELAHIVKSLDTTRLVTSGLTENEADKNFIYQSGALDLLGFNYKHQAYVDLPNRFPGGNFLASETSSAFATRGHYDMPSDSIQRWPAKYKEPIPNANPDFTVSAYDMISAYWGSTHEETWREVKKLDHMAGIFVWAGFDYLGEPDPYPYPARSSYLGIIDLAGFPKDAYYLYQSEWSKDTMLHVFPHWNWEEGQEIDVWAYYNYADEAELFINGKSLGIQTKGDTGLHVQWRVNFEPGMIKVVSRRDGKEILSKEIKTAGNPARVNLTPDRSAINEDGYDLSFITVDILDDQGVLTPHSDNLVQFEITGPGKIVGVDNGYQASWEPFKASQRKAWKGKCLVIVQSEKGQDGEITLTAKSEGLKSHTVKIRAQ